eukprot:261797_1
MPSTQFRNIKKTLITLFLCGAILRMAVKYRQIDRFIKTPKQLLLTSLMFYILWIYTLDRHAGSLSNRKSSTFIRFASIPANYLKKHYFPAVLLRDFSDETAIDPNKKYIIAFHPHGIMGISFLLHFLFSNDALSGLDYRIVTLSLNFSIPFVREILLFLGMTDASRSTITSLLSRNTSVGIVVGGSAEAMNSRPGTNDLTLATRIGFVQCAIECGADIIPVFTFGENDLFEPILSNKPGSALNKWQLWFKDKFSFIIPFVTGTFWILPQRKPLHTVIGRPIKIKQMDKPSLQEILRVHTVYMERLQDLYDRHKHLYPQRKHELNVVDKVSPRKMNKWIKHIGKENHTLAKL